MLADSKLCELIKKIAVEGDAVAFKTLFLSYYNRLARFAYSFTKAMQPAEEIVSDVFLKLWKTRTSLTEVQNIHLYLYVMTKNASLNYLQKEKKTAFFSLDQHLLDLPDIGESPEQRMMNAEIFQQLQTAVAQLPPKCRLIFKLVKEDGLKYKEVAVLLDISQKTVEAQMTIALKRIGSSVRFYASRVTLN